MTNDRQPDELNELKKVVSEYLERDSNIENEIKELQERRSDLKKEFEDRIDMKTLKKVLQVLKIESTISHKHTFDTFYEVLKDPTEV